MTFTDDHTVLLSWNQQQPRNVVVQRSTDGGLTYSPITSIAAPDAEFPGPLRFIKSQDVVYMPFTKGEQVNLAVSRDGGTTWTDCKVASGDFVKGGTAGFAVADHDAAGNVYVVWADSSDYHTWLSVLTADKLAACNQSIDSVSATADGEPTVDAGFSAPLQVDRDSVRTTVFPWVAAGGAPGRVAVTFYGSTADGDPNSGDFKAAWNVYVNQSVNALDATRTISQVQATTHPFHYDSICLNGLGCDLAVPPGDRTLADFFAIGYDPVSGRLSVVFNRDGKKPDEALGHVGTPMVLSQIAGPSNNGSTIAVADRATVRASSTDPTGDAQSNYSLTAPGAVPPDPPTKNESAADFTSASIGPDAATGGFTVTLKVASLSSTALTQALLDTGGQSLLWVWRFANGYQDSAASARWNPVTGFTFGWTTTPSAARRVLHDGRAGREVRRLSGQSADHRPGRPGLRDDHAHRAAQLPAAVERRGCRRQAARAARGGRRPLLRRHGVLVREHVSPTQDTQSFLYTLDNTPAMDFLLP